MSDKRGTLLPPFGDILATRTGPKERRLGSGRSIQLRTLGARDERHSVSHLDPAQACHAELVVRKIHRDDLLAKVVAFSQPLTSERLESGNDREVTFRVMNNLPVIVFDKETRKRKAIPTRRGFPHPKDWRRPQPIHARSETIETTKAFASAFLDGQRGIVLMKTFNEAPDVEGPTIQHTVTPGDEPALADALVWRRFDVGGPMPLLACCLCTVPANELIRKLPTDRMPAFLAAEDWETRVGEKPTSVDEVKACLRTVEGVKWTTRKEERKGKARSIVSDADGVV